jgi:hypothetical protein
MHIPRLLILPLLVSVYVAQPLPGNARLLQRHSYICSETWPVAVPPWMKNLFPRPVVFQQSPTTAFPQDESTLTRIATPPEFRPHDFTMVDASGTILFRVPGGSLLCHGIHSDAQGRVH